MCNCKNVKQVNFLLLNLLTLDLISRKLISLEAYMVIKFPANHPATEYYPPGTKMLFLRPDCIGHHKHISATVERIFGGMKKKLTKLRLRGGCQTIGNHSLNLFDLGGEDILSDEPIWNNRHTHPCTSSAESSIENLNINTSQIITRFQSDAVDREQLRTSLWVAAFSGSQTKLIEALAAGAEVNARNEKFCRWGAVHYAVHHDEPHLLSILLDAGARVDLPCNLKVRALHLAAMNGSLRAVKFLLQAGAYRNPIDQFGRTPLHYAAAAGQLKVVQVLLEADADMNAQDCAAATPLAAAARFGHEEVASLLVARGADVSIEDRFGCTPTGIAVKMRHFSTAAACRTRDPGKRRHNTGQTLEDRVLPDNASSHAYDIVDDADDNFWQDEIVYK
jgi:hypothetical protein